MTLPGWTAAFSKCLQGSPNRGSDGPCNANGDGSFVLLDNVMESDAFNDSFCENLSKELDKFMEKLKPARTTGDHRADEILNILQSMGTQIPTKSENPSSKNAGDRIRGDKNIFVSREYRRKRSFTRKHPHLHRLISATSQTLDSAFSKDNDENCDNGNRTETGSIQLDFSMTSVQLAIYPGDSKSGYRRHCDRANSCQQEGARTTNNQNSTKPERLVTCIYYLTDDDWDSDLDGGALRLFHADDTKNPESSSYTDVFPFRDRMVMFRSDQVEHQVMPSHRRPRLAITMWFYGTIDAPNQLANASLQPTTTAAKILPLPIQDVSYVNDQSPSIFVSIASYRDSETRPTIDAMYSTALHPQRIFTGIVAQLVEGEEYDEDIWRSISDSKMLESQQLRVMRIHARDATGPCYARGLCQSLYRGEDYVLQIDSHMRFRQNWDEYLIQTIRGLQDQRRQLSIGNELEMAHCDKIMLTAYPIGYTLPNKIPTETRGTYLVPWKFDEQGRLRQRGRLFRRSLGPEIETEDNPVATDHDSSTITGESEVDVPTSVSHAARQFLYAGGFNFGPSRVIWDVPYDTMGLHHLFFGEELSMAVRLFTHGYDLYAPEETVCYHLWSRSHRPTNTALSSATKTAENNKKLREFSQAIVQKQLLGDEKMIGAHCGLGKVRTAAAFAHHLGVDFDKQSFVREGWDCGELNSRDFVWNGDKGGEEPLFPADSVEAKVASLDHKTQSVIGMFLQGMQ